MSRNADTLFSKHTLRSLLFALGLALATLLLATYPGYAQEPVSAPGPEAAQAPLAVNGTTIEGTITTDSTWTKAGSPYNVIDFTLVASGVKLTIEPGVQVVFGDPTDPQALVSMGVDGILDARGTAAEPIVFTGLVKEPGEWGGLEVSNTSEQPAQVSFDHVIVEYGEIVDLWGGANLKLGYAAADINNSTFRFGGANGLVADDGTTLNLRNSTFTGNKLNAVWFESGLTSDPLFDNLTATQNGIHNAVVYHGVDISSAHRMEVMGLPYVISGGLDVDEGAKLVIDPGLTLRLDTGFYVRGELQALGTAAEPIVLTGNTQTPGSWWGLSVSSGTSTATAHLDHVTIEYGGGTMENDSTANLVVSSANVTVTNSIIRNGNNHGIFNRGGAPGEEFTVKVSNTALTGHRLAPVVCDDESCHYQLAGLTVSGNGSNGIVYRSQILGTETWRNMGIPYIVEGQSGVDNNGTLTIEPGVQVLMTQGASFHVDGILSAAGTQAQRIIFTGTQQQPGWWDEIRVGNNAVADLRYCDIGFGGQAGANTDTAQITTQSNGLTLNNCHIHHSSGAGIMVVAAALPLLRNNNITDNQVGLHVVAPQATVDARNNWWGHASGPKHTNNPNGQGQEIIGNAIFDPWLTGPDDTGGNTGITVDLAGPGIFAPGATVVYSVFYHNGTGATIDNAVLRFGMPGSAVLVEASPGAVFHTNRNHVFWKLGSLPQHGQGLAWVRVRYDAGLADGHKSATAAQLSGTNLPGPVFDVAEYNSYVPRTLDLVTDLTLDQVNALLANSAELNTLYQQAIADGFKFGAAEEHTYSSGQKEVEIRLLQFQPQFRFYSLYLSGSNAVGVLVDGSSYAVLRDGQAIRYDVQSNSWTPTTVGSLLQTAATDDGISWGECVSNCIEDKLPGFIIKKKIKSIGELSKISSCVQSAQGNEDSYLGCAKYIGKVVPGVGEGIDLGECNGECQLCVEAGGDCDDPNCHCCTEDKYRCDADDWIYKTFADREIIKQKKCVLDEGGDGQRGTYLAETAYKVCASCEKCIDRGTGMPVCTVQVSSNQAINTMATLMTLAAQQGAQDRLEVAANSDQECDECRVAKDPNEMYGPAGDLLPGELITYEIAYENIGAGVAFGVFIANKLPENVFDLQTLQINNGGTYSAGAGSIYWNVGDLAPQGQPGSSGKVSYSVRLRADLPSGTPISNQAVVHFPSVPEETPTNRLINLVKPLVADPQSLQSEAGVPIAITLTGKDAANAPLTFTVVDGPLYGTLSGSAPNLTYTPDANASGLDTIRFTVSNGSSTSVPADVSIRILPSASDVTGPGLKWTAPANGEGVNLAVLLMGEDSTGKYYYPAVQAQFNEAVDPATVNSQTVIVTDATGKQLSAAVRYDATSDQLQLMLREQPQVGQAYAVTITTGVKDLRGNPMSAAYAWSFSIAGVDQPAEAAKVFLPMVAR